MNGVVAAVRCRPLTRSEELNECEHAVEIIPDTKQVVVCGERAFTLNHVFSDKATQDNIYDELVDPVVDKVMCGYNACVMAYGQTGSGKTFTMGTKAKATIPGIVQKALSKVFSVHYDSEVHVSFLEVYKEEVIDLLSTQKKRMHVIDFKPVGLTLVKTESIESALSVMEKGLGNRHVGATNANLHSSRSHAVFTIHFTKTTELGQCTSKLYLVDLAGSESVSEVSGDTRREGVMINKGLLQLGMVMAALSSAGTDHIPYRNSALTSILRDTLSPQNYVVLIACVSPLKIDSMMTTNSLQFASRVGSIKCNPEAGLVIKQRIPVTTPFKVPQSYKIGVNSTIATPGSHRKIQRPVLRPLNNTIDSPRTPRVQSGKKQYWPTSTPFHNPGKPHFAEPTPILKGGPSGKRRSSSEWNTLDISTSTVVETTAAQIKSQAGVNQSLVSSSENELWLRSLIADVIREELKSHTLSYNTSNRDGPSPPKHPRRSARLSNASKEYPCFFDQESDKTIVSSSPNNRQKAEMCSDTKLPDDSQMQPEISVCRNTRLSTKFSRLSQTHRTTEAVPQQKSQSKNRSITKDHTGSVQPVRRSTRLSVAPRPVYFEKSPNKVSSFAMKGPKVTRKATRFSTRLSVLPQTTPENAQESLNRVVLDILKFGDVKKLQSLPTIGPKTAIIISNHRLLHGSIESFRDLRNIHGLSANFTKRFLWANNIVLEEDSESS